FELRSQSGTEECRVQPIMASNRRWRCGCNPRRESAVAQLAKLGHLRDFIVMSDKSTPRPYEQWRTNAADREEDAAYTFAFYLMKHCRAEALKEVQSAPVLMTRKQFQKQVEAAVDTALHNVMDLLE